jgi:hypothetical protein
MGKVPEKKGSCVPREIQFVSIESYQNSREMTWGRKVLQEKKTCAKDWVHLEVS